LVRCLAGLNRSGLVLTLVMIMAGYSAIDAIEQIRIKRSEWVLHNPDFERWLLELDVTAWQRGRV
jgi:protein-tyrosine phosphatase